jgi:ABC-type amino acid transport substrate-binding protein
MATMNPVLKTLRLPCIIAILTSASMNISYADNFVIGVENIDYFPIYQYKDGQYNGAASEILNQFAKSYNHTFSYKAFPITRLNKNYLSGKVDFRFPDNGYWAQDQKSGFDIKYSNSVIDFIDGVMVTPENKGKGVSELKKLGLVRGFTAWDYLGYIKKGGVKAKETNSLESLIKLTQTKRYDGAYFNVDVATYYLNNTLKTPKAIVFDPELPHTKSNYSLSSFKHHQIIEQFNKFLIDEADWVRTIKDKYQVR